MITPGKNEIVNQKRSRRRINILSRWTRWLHLYISMLGLLILLFFAVTGFTLNHAEWFDSGSEHVQKFEGRLNSEWLGLNHRESDHRREIDKLAIVEYFQTEYAIHGSLTEFAVEEYQSFLIFKGPGYTADIMVDSDTGEYAVTVTTMGFFAILNDLHKGRDSGTVWSWVIDVSAIIMTVTAATGLFLLFTLKKRQRTGLIVGLVGALTLLVIFIFLVP